MSLDSDEIAFPLGFLHDLAEASSLERVLDVAAGWVTQIVDAERASVGLLSDEGDLVSIFALQGTAAVNIDQGLPMTNTLIGHSITHQRQLYTRDLTTDPNIDSLLLAKHQFRSCVNSPLISSGRCYGSLNVASTRTDGFTHRHLAALDGVAGMLASYVRIHAEIEREQRRARTDELTGLLSRRAILNALRTRLVDDSEPPTVLYIDLDDFKLVNDTYGHAVGDVVLHHMADRLRRALRTDDLVGRIGGDEFLILLGPPSGEAEGLEVGRRLTEICSDSIKIGELTLSMRPSIGVAVASADLRSAETLLTEADLAMYRAKRSPKSIVVADDSVRRHVDLVAAIDRDIKAAMTEGRMTFAYQAIRSLATGEVLGCEQLVRWNHRTHGPIPPPLIIDRIEANGLTTFFTRWALDRAAQDLSRLRSVDPAWSDKAFAMNLDTSQLDAPDHVESHLATLQRYGLQPQDIIVELVELQTVEVDSQAEQTLRDLAANGVIIGLDDFGTGHNVLSYFGRFPIHSIKFDRMMIADIAHNETMRIVTKSLVHLAHELGIETLAEGIEYPEQIDACRRLGIEKGQGFLLCRPMPLEELMKVNPQSRLEVSLDGTAAS